MKQSPRTIQSSHSGVLKVETLLSMLVLVVAMNFAGPMIARINQLWTHTQTNQFAIDELSNQMDMLIRMAPEKVEEALPALRVSEAFQRAVPEAQLKGTLSEDELGRRVTLSLSWLDVPDAKPIQLTGWLIERDLKVDADRGGDP